MFTQKSVFISIALLALFGTILPVADTTDPVNQCIILPEIIHGGRVAREYQPDSCVALEMEQGRHNTGLAAVPDIKAGMSATEMGG